MDEKFIIDPTSDGITESDGSLTNWKDIWVYKVPINQQIVIDQTDSISMSLVGDNAAAMPNRTRVKISIRNIADENERIIFPECPYIQVKEFQDKNLIMKFRSLKKEVTLRAGERVCIQVAGVDATGTGDTDASASTFSLPCRRRR